MTEQEAIQYIWEEFHPDSDSYATFCEVVSNALKSYAAAENQRLRDMLKAIIDHADQPAMDDALFRKFARANAQDVLNEEGGDNVG